jgi:hypothetical protein
MNYEEGEPMPLYSVYMQWLINNKYVTNN